MSQPPSTELAVATLQKANSEKDLAKQQGSLALTEAAITSFTLAKQQLLDAAEVQTQTLVAEAMANKAEAVDSTIEKLQIRYQKLEKRQRVRQEEEAAIQVHLHETDAGALQSPPFEPPPAQSPATGRRTPSQQPASTSLMSATFAAMMDSPQSRQSPQSPTRYQQEPGNPQQAHGITTEQDELIDMMDFNDAMATCNDEGVYIQEQSLQWMTAALRAHFRGQPIPPPGGAPPAQNYAASPNTQHYAAPPPPPAQNYPGPLQKQSPSYGFEAEVPFEAEGAPGLGGGVGGGGLHTTMTPTRSFLAAG